MSTIPDDAPTDVCPIVVGMEIIRGTDPATPWTVTDIETWGGETWVRIESAQAGFAVWRVRRELRARLADEECPTRRLSR